MKVLYLTNIPSPYRVDFFNELGKLCELTVLFERKSAVDREKQWLSKSIDTFTAHYLSGIAIGSDSACSFEVINFLKHKKYDVIVIGGYSTLTGMIAIMYMRFYKIPFILNADGGFISKDTKLKFMLKRFLISSACYWLSSSEHTSKYLEHYGAKRSSVYKYPFTSLSNIDLTMNPIDSGEKLKLRKELNIDHKNVVLAVGRFIPIKGFETLIKTAPLVGNSTRIFIVGGKMTSEYSELVEKLELTNVDFIDFKSKEELSKFYKISDLFVLPTKGDVWGLVINEAMSFGLPVITTERCVAGLELIEDWKNGFILPVDDVEKLAEKINIVLNDDGLLRKMSINNLRKIKKYTIENMSKIHIEIFEMLMEKENDKNPSNINCNSNFE